MGSNIEFSVNFGRTQFLKTSKIAVSTNRLNWRAEVLIAENRGAIEGKRILDLASCDGRFSYAALMCGAKYVLGVDGRQQHVDNAEKNLDMAGFGSDRYKFICGDLVGFLKNIEPQEFDTILCFGVFSHLIEQVEVLREIQRITPEIFILDTWVARERRNIFDRLINNKINDYVEDVQVGKPVKMGLIKSLCRKVRCIFEAKPSDTGTLVFLYENPAAEGATISSSGLMAWPTKSVVKMLFQHFGFSYNQIDWKTKNIKDWDSLNDYKKGTRGSWIATPNSSKLS
jgi:Methyltransferase domain